MIVYAKTFLNTSTAVSICSLLPREMRQWVFSIGGKS
ncbi:uncharacterized protein METZ01_LOCUS61743, partial [marine metagenome]